MRTDYSTKQAARQAIWDRLMNEKLAAFRFHRTGVFQTSKVPKMRHYGYLTNRNGAMRN